MSIESVRPIGVTAPKDQNISVSDNVDSVNSFDFKVENYGNVQFPTPKTLKPGNTSREQLIINGLNFYLKLNRSESVPPSTSHEAESLEDSIIRKHKNINDMFIIASHTTVIKNENEKPVCKFAAFDSPREYLPWMDKKPIEHCNDFEYIINPIRKFFVDIDGSLLPDADYAKYNITKEDYIRKYNDPKSFMQIISYLIDKFQAVIGESLDLQRDVMLCCSCGRNPDGTYKFSYHLIFTKYLFHYEDCISLRLLLVDGLDDILKYKMIDPSVYKSKQQLRLLENQKLGSGRIKKLLDIDYKGTIIKHLPPVPPLDDNHLRQMIFLESLIGFAHNHLPIKALKENVLASLPNKRRRNNNTLNHHYEGYNLSEDEYNEIMRVFLSQHWSTMYTPRCSYETSMSSIWFNKIVKNAVECPIHKRVHRGTNGAVINVDVNGVYRFHCMSAHSPHIESFEQYDIVLGRLSKIPTTIINIDNSGREIQKLDEKVSNNKSSLFNNPYGKLTTVQVPAQGPTQGPTQVSTQVPAQITSQVTTQITSQVPTQVPTKDPSDNLKLRIPLPESYFKPGIVREISENKVQDFEYKNGVIVYRYFPKRYNIREEVIFNLGNTYQSRWYGGNDVCRIGEKGDNILTESDILDGFDHLFGVRATIDCYYNYKQRKYIDFNNVCSCVKEITLINNLPVENIKKRWIKWMNDHSTDGIEYDYDQIWDDADPFIWTSQHFLKWIILDSHGSEQYFSSRPQLYIMKYLRDELKFNERTKSKRTQITKYPDSVTEINDLDLNQRTLLIKAGTNMKKTVKMMSSLVKGQITDCLLVCQRVSGGLDLSGRLKKKLNQEDLIETKGTPLEHCFLYPTSDTLVTYNEFIIAADMLSRLDQWFGPNKPRVIFYRDLKPGERIPPNTWLIIQVESIPKLMKMNYTAPQVIVFDESTSILKQLSAKTIKTNEMATGIVSILDHLIRTTPIFIALCAQMDSRTIRLVERLRSGDIHYHKYDKKIGNDLSVDRYTCFDTLLNEAGQMVMSGKRIFIACTWKSEAQSLESYFSSFGKKVLCIHRDSPKHVRDTLLDVNATWINYDIVIVTNVITTSVDFHLSHFHAVCAFVHNNTIDFRTITQMLRRVRYPIDKRILIHMNLKIFNGLDIFTSAIARKKRHQIDCISKAANELKSEITAPDRLADTLGERSKIPFTDSKGILRFKYEESHWFTDIHFLNLHEDNMSKTYMNDLFFEWIDEQQIPLTFHAYVYFNPKCKELYQQCAKENRAEKKEIEASAPVNSNETQVEIKEKMDAGDATYEEKVSYEKTKIIERFKDDSPPDEHDRSFFKNHYDVINNSFHHKMNNIQHLLVIDNKRFVSIFHTELNFDKQHAITKFCSLIQVLNLLTDRSIPPDITSKFNMEEVNTKSQTHVLIHFDTRYFTQGTPVPGKEISKECLETAYLCTGAFDMHDKSITRVNDAMNIFIVSLHRFINAEVIPGNICQKQIDNQRFNFTPYLICVNKRIINIVSRLKTYEELDKNKIHQADDTKIHTEQLKSIRLQKAQAQSQVQPQVQPQPHQHQPQPPPPKLINTNHIGLPKHDLPPPQPNNNQSQSQSQNYPQINPLELLVEFSLKYSKNKDARQLTKDIREKGYQETFRSYRITIRSVTKDIDKYLKSLGTGLSWQTVKKSYKIKPETTFPYTFTYERTKYE
jgi:hypothetical protein